MTFSATEKSMDRSLSKKDFMQAGLEMGPSMHETCKRGQDPQRKAEACVLLVPQLDWRKKAEAESIMQLRRPKTLSVSRRINNIRSL
ncbi:unnamed protein product [Rhizophagus irregularis]|uniref:Uncharacterized protein n=1 Tax=Rhizophagus irregularis TaxID=588596 RepID=A0A915ZPN1_9GLOM|nr:unnamed protein product [Rhizophagus irregularis]